jgi:hypothetical protein
MTDMSYAADEYYPVEYQPSAAQGAAELDRSMLPAALFLIPVLITGLSYLSGGVGPITDLGFLLLTVLCVVFLFKELIQFPKQQGIGAILIYGGVLVWFCHDYMTNWFGRDFGDPSLHIPVHVVAKAAFYHALFVDVMLLVFRRPFMRWAEKLVVAVPEPSTPQFYVVALIAIMAVGMSPFVLFVNEPLYSALWKTVTLREDQVAWTVGRTIVGRAANLNYSWGGYVAQILQIGMIAGVLGAAYAILEAKTWAGRIFGLSLWLFWVLYCFNTYRRGDMAFMVIPAMGFLYYRYQVLASGYLKRAGWKAYALVAVVGLTLILVIQYQISVRSGETLQAGQVFEARGNTMFSEGIKAWAIFGEDGGKDYYSSDDFFGASIVEPIPMTAWWFGIDWIPRALWTTKPIDQFAAWYNDLISGEHLGMGGTTVSGGAVGQWYFRYGPAGVIEGGLMYGWLMGVCERALRRAKGRPIGVLFAFCFATFLFRAYRDLWFHLLYPVMIGGVALFLIVWPIRAIPAEEPMPAVV